MKNVSTDTKTSRYNEHLGIILCKHCGCIVETIDTTRVAIFYGICDHKECLSNR